MARRGAQHPPPARLKRMALGPFIPRGAASGIGGARGPHSELINKRRAAQECSESLPSLRARLRHSALSKEALATISRRTSHAARPGIPMDLPWRARGSANYTSN